MIWLQNPITPPEAGAIRKNQQKPLKQQED